MRAWRLISWAGLLAGAACIAWCSRSSDAEPAARDIDALSRLTKPPGASSFPVSAPVRRGWSVEASWELETTMEWRTYRAWVRKRLAGYDVSSQGERTVVFRRSVPGDAYSLEIESISPGPPLRIRVDYHASPD